MAEYPLTRGQELELTILRAGDGGDGVAVCDGLTVFVAHALPGEVIRARVTECRKKYARAALLCILSPSPLRQAPACALFVSCGGCALQHLPYAQQLALKQKRVTDALLRLGGVEKGSYTLDPILGMELPLRYRNKATFAVTAGNGGTGAKVGFFEADSHTLIPATSCLLQSEQAETAAHTLQRWLEHHRVDAYDPATGKGLVRGLMVRVNRKGDALVTLIAASAELPHQSALIEAMRAALPTLCGLCVSVNTKPDGAVLGEELHTLWGEPSIEETLNGLTFTVSPAAFFQVNTVQTERLYDAVRRFAAPQKGETVLDAYCGAGTIGLTLAADAKEVIGIEIVPPAVDDARRNAARNHIANARFFTGKCEILLPEMVRQGLSIDLATIDPPRRGCDETLLRALAQAAPSRIVYISCDPATLARDVKLLTPLGYAVKRVQPVDMFPQTAHVETVVLITRVDK